MQHKPRLTWAVHRFFFAGQRGLSPAHGAVAMGAEKGLGWLPPASFSATT